MDTVCEPLLTIVQHDFDESVLRLLRLINPISMMCAFDHIALWHFLVFYCWLWSSAMWNSWSSRCSQKRRLRWHESCNEQVGEVEAQLQQHTEETTWWKWIVYDVDGKTAKQILAVGTSSSCVPRKPKQMSSEKMCRQCIYCICIKLLVYLGIRYSSFVSTTLKNWQTHLTSARCMLVTFFLPSSCATVIDM